MCRQHALPEQLLHLRSEQVAEVAQVPTEHDRGDVEHVDDPGEGHTQRARRGSHCGHGLFVTGTRLLRELGGWRRRVESRGREHGQPAGIPLQAARRAAAARRPLRVDAHVADLARPAVPSAHHVTVDDDRATDAHLSAEVDEVRWFAAPGRGRPGEGVGRQVGLVADAELEPLERSGQRCGRRDVLPAQVGGAEQATGRDVDEAGEGEPGADDPPVRRCRGDHPCREGAQAPQRRTGLGPGEVGDDELLGDDRAGQVDEAGGEVADTDLQAQGGKVPGGPQRGRGAPPSARPSRDRVDLLEDQALDELVDEARDGRAGQRRRRSDIGP